MILNDRQIMDLVHSFDMINPFDFNRLNSFGYDLTLDSEFWVLTTDCLSGTIIDPMNISKEQFRKFSGEYCIIPPNSFVLGKSVEYIKMPSYITGICIGRSTYARVGIIANITPLEAGWEGIVNIELSNSCPLPAKVYAKRGIIQVVFFAGDNPDRDYVQKGGRYQFQIGVQLPRGV